MSVLADTHALLWALTDPALLSAAARQALSDLEVVVSVVSLWELVLKGGKIDALLQGPVPWWEKYVIQSGVRTLGDQDIPRDGDGQAARIAQRSFRPDAVGAGHCRENTAGYQRRAA